MKEPHTPIINIGLVGGGEYCQEILNKSILDYRKGEVNARILAVADPDPESPGMVVARSLGFKTISDYRKFYEPDEQIHLIVILTPDQDIQADILTRKPRDIRVLTYHSFKLFWEAIGVEERKLRNRNKEVETIINGIRDFIIVIDPEMKIVEVNDWFRNKMGYTTKDLVGKKCYEIFQKRKTPCQVDAMFCPLEEVKRGKKPVQQILTRTSRCGECRYIEVTTFPIWDKNGAVEKYIEISRDVTKRKLEEQEITRRLEYMVEDRTRQLNETHDKLLHQDKMASLGKLSASVVHEINNPMAGILNLTMLMKRIIDEGDVTPRDVASFGQYLSLIENETRRISRIVSNLLVFSRQSQMHMTQLNLNALIEKILFLNANLLKINNVRVENRLDPSLPDIEGSEDKLQQVIMNFISNAVESMENKEEGGVLTIETRQLVKNNAIQAAFTDTGMGIPQDNLSNLFEPFFTTKKKGKGVGLGLSVAYGIIEEHEGTIHVDTKVNHGTTFTIELPFQRKSKDAKSH